MLWKVQTTIMVSLFWVDKRILRFKVDKTETNILWEVNPGKLCGIVSYDAT
jgi:hypothetical protein